MWRYFHKDGVRLNGKVQFNLTYKARLCERKARYSIGVIGSRK
jgi:hypothetical protein